MPLQAPRKGQQGKDDGKFHISKYGAWFRDVVWRNYERYRPTQLANAPGCLQLDGTADPTNLVARCAAHCCKAVGVAKIARGSLAKQAKEQQEQPEQY